ncbi:MAG: hypothetical protein WD065_02580 [Planctomycetaceae bacterium]
MAATWARFEIKLETPSESRWLTQLIRSTSNSVDRGVYGPLFPLAEWIVENWWFLLHESCRVPEFANGRSLANDPNQREWVRRHNLLGAREGGALPDLTIYRDGNAVMMKWEPDPYFDERIRPVRFIEEGLASIEPTEVERELHRLVDSVLERLTDKTDDSVQQLRTNWNAIGESRQNESTLCALAASMGLDPYNENELTDELIEVINSRVCGLPVKIRHDLADVTNGESLVAELDWLDRALPKDAPSATRADEDLTTRHASAHQTGYEKAAQVRQTYSLPLTPLTDLKTLLHDHCGWSVPEKQFEIVEGTKRISSLVTTRDNRPLVVGPTLPPQTDRFRLARSLYFFSDNGCEFSPRLVTRAFNWDQRVSRAFAAELLAPAEALRSRIDNIVGAEEVEQLGREFGVDPKLIEHQIKNHRLAWIDEE